MSGSAWTELPELDYDRYWDRFFREFKFRPDVSLFPGIKEPTPSITWSIESAWLDPDPLMRKTHSSFNEAMLPAFKRVIAESASLIVLEWHGTCYKFRPRQYSGSFIPIGNDNGEDETASWKVAVIPDGEYYIFLSEDFRFGTFGHPWESTICVWGEELLEAMGPLPLEGATIARRNGIAV